MLPYCIYFCTREKELMIYGYEKVCFVFIVDLGEPEAHVLMDYILKCPIIILKFCLFHCIDICTDHAKAMLDKTAGALASIRAVLMLY